ncbi:MAG TPA: DUF2281 domain-containing protein [Pyrinomonadaceae bacterium]|nr:DUF2281 domain-containing protein [Pyrinomonadaceae bacterium]
MQTEIAQTIFNKVKSLPPESQKEVLDFVDRLQAKSAQNGEPKESNLEKLWREIDEIVARVPEEAWDEVPTDGAENVDHYLYGAPKKQK